MADTKISALTELASVDDTADELAIVDDSAGSTKRITLATILSWLGSVTQTLTNKTLTSPKINEDVAVTATATEINHTDGVTSAIQTQLNAKGTLSNVVEDTTPQLGGDLDLNGNELTGVGGYKIVYKSADETVNNSTTLQDDDDLVFAVGANEVWGFSLNFIWNSGSTPDMKRGWSVPSGTTMCWSWVATSNCNSESQTELAASSGSNQKHYITGTVFVGGTGGNITFQWAQNTQDMSDTIVKEGSYIVAHRLA